MEKHINEVLSEKDFNNILQGVRNNFKEIDFEQLSKDSYKEDREYPENFSNWYPHIKSFGDFANAEIISNQILTWEETEILREEYYHKVDWNKLNEILKPTLDKMKPNTRYNIKNGCFSNKFDFEVCTVTKDELAQKLWQLTQESLLFETGGYTEVVVRKYIPNDLGTQLTIYNGMPLRTEVRVFYNMDTKEIEYIVDYWDYDYCHNNLYKLNDRIIFDVFHNKIDTGIMIEHKKEFETVSQLIKNAINTLEFDNKLTGIWSIDFMYVREKASIYLIDMARGYRSAYWDIDKLKPETKKKLLN